MPRLAVLGHPVAHSRSPAMQNAALAELGLGEEWSYEAIDVAPDGFEARVRAMPGRGFVGRQRHRPPQGRGAGRRRHAHGDRPRDRRRQHAELRRRRDPRRQHRRRRPARGAAGLAGGRPGAGARAPAAPPARWSGRCCARAPRSRSGTAPRCAPATSARSSAARRSRSPTPAAYELIVNSTAVGLRGEDPFARAAARPEALRARAGRRRHGLRRRARRRCCAAAEAAGAATVDGIEVLVRQGALSLRDLDGREPPLDAMRAAARA